MSSPFTHIPTPHAPQLVNLPPDPPPSSHVLLISPHPIPPQTQPGHLSCLPAAVVSHPFAPQSAVLFLESLLGQENVYTVAMVRNPPSVRQSPCHVALFGSAGSPSMSVLVTCACTVTFAWERAP